VYAATQGSGGSKWKGKVYQSETRKVEIGKISQWREGKTGHFIEKTKKGSSPYNRLHCRGRNTGQESNNNLRYIAEIENRGEEASQKKNSPAEVRTGGKRLVLFKKNIRQD